MATLGAGALAASSLASCGTSDSALTGAGGSTSVIVPPGEVCTAPVAAALVARFEPAQIVLPRCARPGDSTCVARSVKLRVDPDICAPRTVVFTTSDSTVVAAPANGAFTLHTTTIPLTIQGGGTVGTSTITAVVPTHDDPATGPVPLDPTSCVAAGTCIEATLAVEVLDPTPVACSGTASMAALAGGQTLAGTDGLAGASVSVPAGANDPNANAFVWHIDPFDTTLGCAADITPPGFSALGPAITFGPASLALPREIAFSIPMNPALLPTAARTRHVRVAYSGPAFSAPRTVPVADPRMEKVGDQWALTFKAPRLGTYQAVLADDAGTHTRSRRLTHRAVVGISMGGGGTASFGMRHHDLFDVLAPLGGPVDWTWMLHDIEQNDLGGFRPIAPGTTLADIQITKTACTTGADCKPDETCLGALTSPATPGACTLMPKTIDPYEHPGTFDNEWYEFPNKGTGPFDRNEYAQIFRDLSLAYGNPNGENLTAGAENLPAGVPLNDPSQVGDHPAGQCNVTVDPIPCADATDAACAATNAQQLALWNACAAERCKHTLTLSNYFDDEYNPDGTFPVITVCDGSPQNQALTPYADTWVPASASRPLEVALAVDYNGNGVRDELEPLIRAGHERWYDDGVDGTPSSLEPGYKAGTNDDPAGDDYDAQYNPSGTEQNFRYDDGEKFDDFGLDGVKGTKQQPAYPAGYQKAGDGYDVGEGDGKFTVSRGLQRFWDSDAHSIVRQWSTPPGGALDDDALARIDVWTDGGTRDLFNFEVDAQHLTGALAARNRDTAYLTSLTELAGLDPTTNVFQPSRVDWDDVPGVIFNRYGNPDPSQADIDSGSGQHVGSMTDIQNRLLSAFYFIGSRWTDSALRNHVESDSTSNAAAGVDACAITGTCTITFTSQTTGRSGPVNITFPPGYTNKNLQDVRYPVVFVLHGYGQEPQDLAAASTLLRDLMNSSGDGQDSRLAKAILVFVDGRCRVTNGKAECLSGTFFADSVRPDGAQDETWWLDLIDYVDQHYRTLGESDMDWTE